MNDKSEKMPRWAWTILIVITIALVVLGFWFLPDSESSAARVAIQEKKIEVVAYPDRYTKVPLPYHQWFDFGYEEDFQVKLDGVKDPYIFRVGQKPPKLGDEIPGSRLYIQSLVEKEVNIKIFLRPKPKKEKEK